jgi:hypothetical protein
MRLNFTNNHFGAGLLPLMPGDIVSDAVQLF